MAGPFGDDLLAVFGTPPGEFRIQSGYRWEYAIGRDSAAVQVERLPRDALSRWGRWGATESQSPEGLPHRGNNPRRGYPHFLDAFMGADCRP